MYYYSPFRKKYSKKKNEQSCPFCDYTVLKPEIIKNKAGELYANEYYCWVVNAFPKFEGHTMLVPYQHLTAITAESEEAVLARYQLLQKVLPVLQAAFPNSGVEYFIQTGIGSQSSVPHLHWHLVPAAPDDELRSFEKLGHFYTTKPEEEKVVLFPKRISMSPEELLVHLQQHSQ